MGTRRRMLVAAAGVIALSAAGAGFVIAGTHTPARLGLPAAHTAATPSPALPADPLAAACGSPPAVTPGTGVSGSWVVGPASQAGFRAHEKFAGIQAPHEAVARTERVAGWMTVRDDSAGVAVTGACVAVELADLASIDSLPGMNTRDRDSAVRDMLNIDRHPFARFAIVTAAPVPRGLATEAGDRVAVAGDLEINGISHPATLTLQARTSGGTQVLAAGSTAVMAEDYGVQVPKEADFIYVDSSITLEFAIVLQRR